jgi:hypothetical protein
MRGDDGSTADPWPDMPPLTDVDAPAPDDGHADPPPEPCDDDRLRYGEDPLDLPDTGGPNGLGRPKAGTLDLTLSWATFAESTSAPGILGRIGPVTAGTRPRRRQHRLWHPATSGSAGTTRHEPRRPPRDPTASAPSGFSEPRGRRPARPAP